MKLAYADPPYVGCAHLYRDHPDYNGEVDHVDLFDELSSYDGWVLHLSAPSVFAIAKIAPADCRLMAWVKPFAAFKKNVPVAYAWEPVLVKCARKPIVSDRLILRDWVASPITMKRGLAGAKPEAVCHWAFEVMGARPEDELYDLFPGTNAVTRAWDSWVCNPSLFS